MSVTRQLGVVRGTVQGVGFRPFLAKLAAGEGLAGHAHNAGGVVHVDVEGPPEAVLRFQSRLAREAPSAARVEGVAWAEAAPIGRVATADGSVTATRVDGTQVKLATDSAVFQGDVLETADGAAVGLVFNDDTTFSLGADARKRMAAARGVVETGPRQLHPSRRQEIAPDRAVRMSPPEPVQVS